MTPFPHSPEIPIASLQNYGSFVFIPYFPNCDDENWAQSGSGFFRVNG